jgi:hypothetical protein
MVGSGGLPTGSSHPRWSDCRGSGSSAPHPSVTVASPWGDLRAMLGFPWPSSVPAWRSSIAGRSKAAGRYLMTAPRMIQASVARTILAAKTRGKNGAQLRLRQGAAEGSAVVTFMRVNVDTSKPTARRTVSRRDDCPRHDTPGCEADVEADGVNHALIKLRRKRTIGSVSAPHWLMRADDEANAGCQLTIERADLCPR